MTTLGKILVFINLLFSLITGALIILAFTTRTNWAKGYAQVSTERDVYLKKLETEKQERIELEKQIADKVKAAQDALEQTKKDLKMAQDLKADAEAKALAAEARVAEAEARVKQLTGLAEGLKVEIKTLDERLVQEQERVLKLGLENKKYKAEAIKATTDLQTALERNEQLLAKLVEADRKIAFLEGDTAAKAGREAKNPPPDDVRGRVTATDDASGFITINLGSDNGLSKGNTLEVYRLKPRPTYVGTFRVYDVRPNEAVGKLIGTGPRGRVQKDDEVASRILGSP